MPSSVLGDENKEVDKTDHVLRQFAEQESANSSPGAKSHPGLVSVNKVLLAELSGCNRVCVAPKA